MHTRACTHLQQQDEVIHRVVARIQVVSGAQAVVGVKVNFLVDTGVAQQMEQDLLGDSAGAEVLHFCKGGRRWKGGSEVEATGRNTMSQTVLGCLWCSDLENLTCGGLDWTI